MEWINYKEKKPTNRKSLYLIEFGWHPDVSVITTANWNGKSFYNEDWEECQTILYKDQVRHWFEIVKPDTRRTRKFRKKQERSGRKSIGRICNETI